MKKSQQIMIPQRDVDANKGKFGHVLVLGGNKGMPGAPILAAFGAFEMGAGLVTIATRTRHINAVTSNLPESLVYGINLFQQRTLKSLLKKSTVIIIGPGLGQTYWSKWLFMNTLTYTHRNQVPCIIDADALNLIARATRHQKINLSSPQNIYTPHPGEAARLLNQSIQFVQSNREKAVHALQSKLGGTVVLKGYGSLVLNANQSLYLSSHGVPAMASAGMGDLLCGMIAGLITQGLSPFEACQLGVDIHAKAGESAAKSLGGPGLMASQLIPFLKPQLQAYLIRS